MNKFSKNSFYLRKSFSQKYSQAQNNYCNQQLINNLNYNYRFRLSQR